MIDYPQWVVHLASWLNASQLNDLVLSYWWAWPVLETIHFISLCFLMGGLAIVDFRLIGVYRSLSSATANRLVNVALAAFAVNFVTGLGFIAGNTWKYIGKNEAFDIKMLLILLLGINALVFHFRLRPLLETEKVTALSRVVGLVSILLWSVVIICGRMITFAEG